MLLLLVRSLFQLTNAENTCFYIRFLWSFLFRFSWSGRDCREWRRSSWCPGVGLVTFKCNRSSCRRWCRLCYRFKDLLPSPLEFLMSCPRQPLFPSPGQTLVISAPSFYLIPLNFNTNRYISSLVSLSALWFITNHSYVSLKGFEVYLHNIVAFHLFWTHISFQLMSLILIIQLNNGFDAEKDKGGIMEVTWSIES